MATGPDLSETLPARARDCDAGGEREWTRGDRRSFPFGDRSYDATADGFASFGCFADPYDDPYDNSKVLREIHRVSKPGGKLLIRKRLKQAGLPLVQVRGGCGGSGCEAVSSGRLILLGRRAG